jgi:hypothetical protein
MSEHTAFSAEDLVILDPLLEVSICLLTADPPGRYNDPRDVVDWAIMDLERWAEDATACPDAARRAWAGRMRTRLAEDVDAYQALVARVPMAAAHLAVGPACTLDVALALVRRHAAFPTAETASQALDRADNGRITYPTDPYDFSDAGLARLREEVQAAIDARCDMLAERDAAVRAELAAQHEVLRKALAEHTLALQAQAAELVALREQLTAAREETEQLRQRTWEWSAELLAATRGPSQEAQERQGRCWRWPWRRP